MPFFGPGRLFDLGFSVGQPVEEYGMVATVPGLRFEGKLVLRTRVLADGAVVTLGFTCAGGDEAVVRDLFQELDGSLELRAG